MGSSLMSENLHEMGKIERVVAKLIKGKEEAILLQTLLGDPVQVQGPVSVEGLLMRIVRSFADSISELSPCSDSADSAQIVPVDAGSRSACSGESKKKLVGVKDRRGCYRRRRTSDSWTQNSPTFEDGFGWRKYGQKTILNSEYPRCYYRCTNKYEGCKALKQVQRIKQESILFQITYINHHTCRDKLRAPPLINLDDDYSDPHVKPINLLSFQVNHHDPTSENQENHSKNPIIFPDPVKKEEEFKEDTQSTEDLSEAKSSSVLLDPWGDIIIGSGSAGSYTPVLWDDPMMSSYQEAGSEFHSNSGSTIFHGFGNSEVNQLDDFDSFHFGDQ